MRRATGAGMARLTRLGAVTGALFSCFLLTGIDVAAAGEQLCRQIEAELAAASLAAGNAAAQHRDEPSHPPAALTMPTRRFTCTWSHTWADRAFDYSAKDGDRHVG